MASLLEVRASQKLTQREIGDIAAAVFDEQCRVRPLPVSVWTAVFDQLLFVDGWQTGLRGFRLPLYSTGSSTADDLVWRQVLAEFDRRHHGLVLDAAIIAVTQERSWSGSGLWFS